MRFVLCACRYLLAAQLIILGSTPQATAQSVKTPNAFLASGKKSLRTPALSVDILRYSGTVASLRPRSEPSFDYTPSDLLPQRSRDTYYHLGDLDLRIRRFGANEWTPISTAYRRHPVAILSGSQNEFRTDMTSSLPTDAGLRVIRTWRIDRDELQLEFTITNTSPGALEDRKSVV